LEAGTKYTHGQGYALAITKVQEKKLVGRAKETATLKTVTDGEFCVLTQ